MFLKDYSTGPRGRGTRFNDAVVGPAVGMKIDCYGLKPVVRLYEIRLQPKSSAKAEDHFAFTGLKAGAIDQYCANNSWSDRLTWQDSLPPHLITSQQNFFVALSFLFRCLHCLNKEHASFLNI